MFDDVFDEEDDLPIPVTSTTGPCAGDLLPIAERVARGVATRSHLNGGIPPFPAHLSGRAILDALTGNERNTNESLIAKGYRPTVYEYRDAEGRVIFAVVRYDHGSERKQVRPLRYCGKGSDGRDLFWFSAPRGTKPLMGLDQLALRPDAPVLAVEGEKTAIAAAALFPEHVVVTWPSGASAARHADLSVVKGRSVVAWPDNDVEGRRAARVFGARAVEAGAEHAAVVDVPSEFPPKWDLADDVPCDVGNGALRNMVNSARAISPQDASAILQHESSADVPRRLLGVPPGHSRVDSAAAEAALDYLDAGMGRSEWWSIARCWFYAFGADGLETFDAWSRRGGNYRLGEPAAMWTQFAGEVQFAAPPILWLFRKVCRLAKEAGGEFQIDPDAMLMAEIEAVNESHAVVIRGGKTVVMRETFDPRFGRYVLDWLKKGDFVDKYIRPVMLPGEDGKSSKLVPLGRFWFGSPWRREFDGVVFMPSGGVGARQLNLWRGFAVEPRRGSGGWSMFDQHLLDHVAQGDRAAYEYILNWLAAGVQRLDVPNGTALVLVGPKGAGKSILIEIYGALFEPHKFVTSISEDIVGKFNAHLEHTLLLGVEEAFAPQNRAADGTLKDLITRKTLRLEDKFFSTWTGRNHLRIIMTSNNDHVVRADGSDRRYAVFEVANPHQADADARRVYFGAMVQQMETGGFEAMLADLLARDITGWNPEAIPETEALRRQKLLNLSSDPIQAWYFSRLEDGNDILSGEGETSVYNWSETETVWVPVRDVVKDYAAFAKRHGKPGDDRRLKAKLERYMPLGFEARNKRAADCLADVRQVKHYPFPPLAEARRLFAAATGHKVE